MTPAPCRGLSVYYFGSGSTGSMQRRENGVTGATRRFPDDRINDTVFADLRAGRVGSG